ncbi:hypothetical protein, partial [Phenylobacterium sp.]|uniref:hypothetical protein n=1 Tax=Phenylobacterium sp. TaxID=1871053 RepID=UPI00281261EF
MAEARDWGDFRSRMEGLLERQTGHDLAHWNAHVAEVAPRDEAVLREWLTREGVTGYARMLLVMERFGYPDFMSASAEALMKS